MIESPVVALVEVIADLDELCCGYLMRPTADDIKAAGVTAATLDALVALRDGLRRSEGFPSDGPQPPTD